MKLTITLSLGRDITVCYCIETEVNQAEISLHTPSQCLPAEALDRNRN
jgi:hypothetical protein